MDHSGKVESLPDYVKRVMAEKGLKPIDVQARSDKKIADAYVAKIVSGKAKYPSVVKLQALAAGLGVDEDELFYVARGIASRGKRAASADPWPSAILIKAMGKIVSNPDLTRIVQILLRAKPDKVKSVLKSLEE